MDWLSLVLDQAVVGLTAYYVILAPYSKIEESFNTQAVHDILFHGTDFVAYDNTLYPSVVPRTFWGSVIIAGISKLVGYIADPQTHFGWQLLSRGVLAILNLVALWRFREAVVNAVPRSYGHNVRRWFSFFVLGQFHIIFYAGRMLPNMFALPLAVEAFGLVVRGRIRAGLIVLAVAAIVFRSELAVLEVPLALALVALGQLSLNQMITTGMVGVAIGSILTITLDSWFLQKWSFPELESFVFNVVHGKASDWGVEPWWSYSVKHMPNLLANPILALLGVIGLFSRHLPRRIQALGLGAVAFIGLYSLQPHKELRFVIYAVPVWTAIAAVIIAQLCTSGPKYKAVRMSIVMLTLALGAGAVALSLVKAHVSALNYPGGHAVALFHDIVPFQEAINKTVHVDVLSFRTGHTRFGEEWRASGVTYHRTEDENVSIQDIWDTFDYYIGEMAAEELGGGPWQLIGTVNALDGIFLGALKKTLTTPSSLNLHQLLHDTVRQKPTIYIYKRVEA